MTHEKIAPFLQALEETPDLWCSLDIRVVAILVDGVWHNLFSRWYLTHMSADDVPTPSDFPHLPYFQVFHAVHPLRALPDLIASVKAGVLRIDGVEIRFTPEQDEAFNYYDSIDICERIHDGVRGPFQYGHALTLSWNRARDLYRRLPRGATGLDADLRGLPDPWGGISAVRLHVLEESLTGSGDPNRTLAIVAPLQARICPSECALVDDWLTYTVEAVTKGVGERCALVVTGVDHQRSRVARRISLSGRRWIKGPNGYRITGQERLRGAKLLDLTLQLASFELGQVALEARRQTFPLLLRAYSAVLSRPNFRAALLDPKPTESREFEKNVALLFMYCGLPTEYISDGIKTDAPDLLVEVPGASLVLVVEVTVGPLNQKGKLARLGQRAKKVRERVGQDGDRVLPIIVSAKESAAIDANELEAAKADGIRVLSRDDLAKLFEMATRRATVKQVARFLAPGLVRGPRITLRGLARRNPHAFEEEQD